MENWTPPKDAVVSEDSKSKWTPPSDAILDEKKNSISDSSNGGNITGTESLVSDPPSISKIKQDNIQKTNLAVSDILKQDMAKSFSQNPSPVYKEHYINKLASLGYDKDALRQFGNSISKKQQDPNTTDNLIDDGSGILKYVPNKEDHPILKSIIKGGEFLNEQAINSEQSIEKGLEQGKNVVPNIASYVKSNPSASMKDILTQSAKEEVKGIAGVGKAAFGALGIVSPELIAFNTATQAATNLPDAVKSGAVKVVLPSQYGKSDKENAEIFDKTIQLPFSVVSTIAHLAGHDPKEGSFEKSLYEIGDLITPLVAHGSIQTFKEFKEAEEKIANGTAGAPQLQDYLEVSKSLGNITPDDVVSEAKKQNKEDVVGNLSNITKQPPVEHDELHNKLAELQQKSTGPEFQKLPIEVQSGIMRDIEDTQNDISTKTQEQLNSHIQDADNTAKVAELDDKIEQAKKSQEGQSDVVKQSIQNTINGMDEEKKSLLPKVERPTKDEIIDSIIKDSVDKGEIEQGSAQEKIARESLSKKFDNQKDLEEAIGLSFKAEKGDLADAFLNKGNFKEPEYVYKTPKNEYKVENGGSEGLIIKGSEGESPSESTRIKIIKDYENNFDYTKGKSAFEGISPEDIKESEADKLIAEKSENPNEIIEAHERLLANDEHVQGNATDHLIYENIGKVKQKGKGGYDNFGDPNNIGQGKSRAYFSESKGEEIDTLAQRLSEEAGHEVTPQDIVDFIDKYPNGVSDYTKSLKNPLIKELADRFKKVTGLTLNDRVKESSLSTKEKEFINLEHRNYEQFHKDYLGSYEKGEFNEPANKEGEVGTNIQNEARESQEKGIIEPNEVGVSEEMRAKQRKELGLDELPKVEKQTSHTDEYLNTEANKLVDSKEINPVKLAESILMDDVVTNDIGIAVLNRGAIEIGNKLIDSKNAIDKARSIGDKIANEKASDEYLQHLSDLNSIHKALEKEGTKAGQKLRSFQTSMKEDFSVGGLYSRFKKANGDKPIPRELIDRLDTYSAQISELNVRIKEAEGIISKQSKSIEELQKAKPTTKERIAKVREKRSELFDEWKKYRNGSNDVIKNSPLPIGDEDIKFIAKIALNYLEEGLLTTMQVSKQLKRDVKSVMGIRLSNADFEKVLNTEIDGKKVIDNFDHTELQEKLEADKIKREKLKRKVNNEESAIEFANRSTSTKIKEGVSNVLNVPRSLMASFDFSAPLRQGLVATIAHPSSGIKALGEMFKQFSSAKNFEDWLIKYKMSPAYDLAKKSELYVADPSELHLDGREEAFMSNLAEKIPLIKHGIISSERAYVGYLNKLRTDVFKNLSDELSDQGKTFEKNPEEFKALADFVNSTTGRGKLPNKTIEDAAPLLNSMFFSPRLIASRINLLNPVYYAKMPIKVRMLAVKDMAKFAGAATTILALAKLSGAQVSTDPRNTDFGKIKIGDTRYDILGGFQQYIRLAAQMLTGKKVGSNGKIIDLTKPNFQGQSRGSELLKFARNKLSPAAGMAVDFLNGVDATGKPVSLKNELYTHFSPLQLQDAIQVYKLGGTLKVLSVLIPSMFGVGVQTYNNDKSDSQKKKEFLKWAGQ